MDFTIKPIGNKSAVEIHAETYFSRGHLVLECFEGFLGIERNAKVYHWTPTVPDGSFCYSIQTDGTKRGIAQLDFTIEPSKDGVLLKTQVTNLDTHLIDDIKYNTCLQFKHVDEFRDNEGDYTFLWMESGWTPVTQIRRYVGTGWHRLCQNYAVLGHEPDGLQDGFMRTWGVSPDRAARALIAKQSRSGDLAIGICWDRAFFMRNNMNDSHHCIHSQGQIDDLPPKEARNRVGKIFFAPEGLEQLYAKAARFFGW